MSSEDDEARVVAQERAQAQAEASVRRRRALRSSVLDMLRTMLVIVAVVGGLVLLVPRPNQVSQPSVDVPRAARNAASELGFQPSAPRSLPAGWTANKAVAQIGYDGVKTWRVAWTTAAGTSAGLVQGLDATQRWEATQVTSAPWAGIRVINGHHWAVRPKTDRHFVGWVLRSQRVTTVVVGTASDADLLALASSLAPAPWAMTVTR